MLKAHALGGKTVEAAITEADRHHRREHARCAAGSALGRGRESSRPTSTTRGAGPRQDRRAGGAEVGGDKAKLIALGRQIAMHVAAASPLAVDAEQDRPGVIARERAILAEQAREVGKPEA